MRYPPENNWNQLREFVYSDARRTGQYGVITMTRWFERHRTSIEPALQPGEQLLDADRVIASGRRKLRGVPRAGFVLAVTDRRLLALRASRWLAHPRQVITEWALDDGATLAPAALGRVRLVLPDRTVVTLRPYGPRSVTHLARA